jgi:hypothetical protein
MNIIGANYDRPKIYNYLGNDFNYLLFISCFNLVISRLKYFSIRVGLAYVIICLFSEKYLLGII